MRLPYVGNTFAGCKVQGGNIIAWHRVENRTCRSSKREREIYIYIYIYIFAFVYVQSYCARKYLGFLHKNSLTCFVGIYNFQFYRTTIEIRVLNGSFMTKRENSYVRRFPSWDQVRSRRERARSTHRILLFLFTGPDLECT